MPKGLDFKTTGGRVSGEDMRLYMESYADRFVKNNIRYNVEVTSMRRDTQDAAHTESSGWLVAITNKITGLVAELKFDKIVLCSGVRSTPVVVCLYRLAHCSNPFVSTQGSSHPNIPKAFSPSAGTFDGIVVHSCEFRSRLDEFLAATASDSQGKPKHVVVIGGGKSAMEYVWWLESPLCI
jgi:cation diffusion facilitator CzcD-associated flavoprotein CzcO